MRHLGSVPSLHLPAFNWLVPPWIALTMLILLQADPARAITISQGEYDGNILVIQGETQQANQQVTLDDRFTEWTDHLGRFTFRVRYLPADCMVKLKAGQTVRPAYIANCIRAEPPSEEKTKSGSAGTTGLTQGSAESGSTRPPEPVGLKIVRQPCERNKECMVLCRDDEIAINAFCPDGNARLLSEQGVSCGAAATSYIVAYCLVPLTPGSAAR